jgi:tRNA (guanine-N7-)-methyltransferase
MLRRVAQLLLKLTGWTVIGEVPNTPKAVLIAAPHTSYWDGFVALTYKVAVGLDIRFFAKQSLFWFPLGTLLRGLGGIPLNRDRATSAVDQAVAMFEAEENFFFGLAPEGTRALRDSWKSGFYRIAKAANVPVYFGVLDFRNKQIGIAGRLDLSDDMDADIEKCAKFYAGIEGRWPKNTTPVRCNNLAGPESPKETHRRPIRSFVRRTGRQTPSQQKALEAYWPVLGIEYKTEQLDFSAVFGREAPNIVEIGFGNGDTLVRQATENPDSNYIGIEVHEPGIGHCLLKATEAGITNLRLLMHDAIDVLEQQIPLRSLLRVNLYFPDPWPKKRHHKRRIVQHEFLELIADRLQDGGTLNIATDWANYAEHIDEVLAESDRFSCTSRREHDGDQPLDRPRTKFERRGLKKGHRICDWILTKHTKI